MTDHDRDDDLDLLTDALAEQGELAPTTEGEVARAEREGVEFEGALPDSLARLRETGAPAASRRVIPLHPPSRWRGHAVSMLLGAAAAAALVLWIDRPRVVPAPVGGEPPTPQHDAGKAPSKIAVPPLHACPAACCAGAGCAAAKPELRQCASGRACVACTLDDKQARYRVRIGALAPLDAQRITAPLELCVRAGASVPACAPAHAGSSDSEPWTALPLVTSVADAVAGVSLEVRAAGAKQPIASWRGPVLITATVLCSGLALKPKDDKGDAFGTVSLFLEDTHYVQLAESSNLEELSEIRQRYQGADKPEIFETTGTGAHRFALELGPTDRQDAERVRAALLGEGSDARIVIGDAHRGDAIDVP